MGQRQLRFAVQHCGVAAGQALPIDVDLAARHMHIREPLGVQRLRGRLGAIEQPGMDRRVEEGVPIAQPLLDNPVFPPMVSQMVKIGEETGELDKMLSKVADFYEDEVAAALKALTSILEPLMIVVVGLIVGFIVVSMYLPMFKVYDTIK